MEALFLDDFQPQGVTEAALVRDLAVITWKKMRLEGIEHRQILQALQEPISENDFNMAGLSVVKGMEDFIWDPHLVDDVDVPIFQEYATQMRLLASGERDEAAIARIRQEAEKIVWAAEHQSEILEAHARIRDRRLIGRIGIEKYDRANDYLAKSFYRTLSELRKHQEWHRKQQVIDVTPEPAREK